MMYMPSEEELRLYDKIRPWLRFDLKEDAMVIKESAPEDIEADIEKLLELSRKNNPMFKR